MNSAWWTRTIPLESERDVFARIGQRFLWATAPYFALTYLLSLIGIGPSSDYPQRFFTLWIVAIPLLGGLVDWTRLRRQREEQPGAA